MIRWFMKQWELKLTHNEIVALRSAISTQIEAIKADEKRSADASTELRVLGRIAQKFDKAWQRGEGQDER